MSKPKSAPLTLLSASEFNRLADTTRLGVNARAMARRVLVDGAAPTVVGEEFGLTRQRVHLAVNTMRKAHERDGGDSAWMSVSTVLPHALASAIEPLSGKLRKAKGATRQKVVQHLQAAFTEADAMLKAK